MNTQPSLSSRAKAFAIRCHAQANQEYDNMPYEAHLFFVAELVTLFSKQLSPADRETVIAGAWCHDVIEDARQSYNDVKKELGETIAEISRALTVDPRCRNRDEKHTKEYYAGIMDVPGAAPIKICDRIANTAWSKHKQSPMYEKYRAEYNKFTVALIHGVGEGPLELLHYEVSEPGLSGPCLEIIRKIEKQFSAGTRLSQLENVFSDFRLAVDPEYTGNHFYELLKSGEKIISEMK